MLNSPACNLLVSSCTWQTSANFCDRMLIFPLEYAEDLLHLASTSEVATACSSHWTPTAVSRISVLKLLRPTRCDRDLTCSSETRTQVSHLGQKSPKCLSGEYLIEKWSYWIKFGRQPLCCCNTQGIYFLFFQFPVLLGKLIISELANTVDFLQCSVNP